MTQQWQHTGEPEQLQSDALQRAAGRFDVELATAVGRHEHYWLAIVGFVVDPPLVEVVLDHENIRVPPSIGCFICEQPYRPSMSGKRCKGEPS